VGERPAGLRQSPERPSLPARPGRPQGDAGSPTNGAGNVCGRARRYNTPSVASDSDARPPVLTEVGDFDAAVSTSRGPSRPSGQKSCPCRQWSNPDDPTVVATGGPQPQQPNPGGIRRGLEQRKRRLPQRLLLRDAAAAQAGREFLNFADQTQGIAGLRRRRGPSRSL
jgi:hypothetical protein